MIPGMMLILTSTTWFFAYNQPNGRLATVLSFFPFTAPLMMFMRISVQTPPLWQIATSVALLVATIIGVAWFAGRIYRVGILMYGKKPTLPEIFRWARQAVTASVTPDRLLRAIDPAGHDPEPEPSPLPDRTATNSCAARHT